MGGTSISLSVLQGTSGEGEGVNWGLGDGERRGERKRMGATYQTPRHQAFGLNHNTANYLLLTRKNECGPV